MSLENKVMDSLKDAMKSKNEDALRALRAIKAEIIKAKTEPGANNPLTEADEQKLLNRMAKQRKESMDVFTQNNRPELAQKEAAELAVIMQYLPEQLTPEALEKAVQAIINQVGATSPSDLGKVMGVASKQLNGQADGKAISETVKKLLSQS